MTKLAKLEKIYEGFLQIKDAKAESEFDIDMYTFEELLLIALELKDENILLKAKIEAMKGR